MSPSADDLGFEQIYLQHSDALPDIPWARLEPHPALLAWLDQEAPLPGRALVIGCGLGDDAEGVAARGWQVSAFDAAPTAVALCRQRFPDSSVHYWVGDLFALPHNCRGGFDLVVEHRTLQSLPLGQRVAAAGAIAATVAPGGWLWVRCLARENDVALERRPWPVSRCDLATFRGAGLDEVQFRDEPPAGADRGRCFTVVYRRR